MVSAPLRDASSNQDGSLISMATPRNFALVTKLQIVRPLSWSMDQRGPCLRMGSSGPMAGNSQLTLVMYRSPPQLDWAGSLNASLVTGGFCWVNSLAFLFFLLTFQNDLKLSRSKMEQLALTRTGSAKLIFLDLASQKVIVPKDHCRNK